MADITTIECGERLSIEGVEALYGKMESALQQGADICLDAQHVQYADTAGLQLIAAFQQALNQTGHSAAWSDPSPALLETAGYLGLTATLHLNNPTNTI